jgi:hypothetical protein
MPRDPDSDPQHSVTQDGKGASKAIDVHFPEPKADSASFYQMLGSCCDLFARYGHKDSNHFEPCPADCNQFCVGDASCPDQIKQCNDFCGQKKCIQDVDP